MRLLRLIKLRKFILLYAITFFGILVSTFSSPIPWNFWQKLLYILSNPWLIVAVLSGIFLLAYEVYHFNANENIFLRQENLVNYQKRNCKNLCLYNIIYLAMILVTCLLVGVLCSDGNFSLVIAESYSFPLAIYLIFMVLKQVMIYLLLGYFFYLLFWNLKLVFVSAIFFGLLMLTIFGGPKYIWIASLLDSPLLIVHYLKYLVYADFFTEIITAFIQVVLWFYICFFLFIYTFKKSKRDLVK